MLMSVPRPFAPNAIAEQTRVSDLKGLTVVNQRKWPFLYERLVKEVRLALVTEFGITRLLKIHTVVTMFKDLDIVVNTRGIPG